MQETILASHTLMLLQPDGLPLRSMRKTIPVIGGAAIALAVVLVWRLLPEPEPVADAVLPLPAESDAAVRAEELTPATLPTPSTPSNEHAAVATPAAVRSPLPGETPSTPMAQMLADNQRNRIVRGDTSVGDLPPGLVEGEREFGAEPVDAKWAPGAEADLLAKFAQMSGLKLIDLQVHCRSTMCRVQVTQPPAPPGRRDRTPFSLLSDDLGLTPRWIVAVVDGAGAPGQTLPTKAIAYYSRDGFVPRMCFKDGHPATCSDEAENAN